MGWRQGPWECRYGHWLSPAANEGRHRSYDRHGWGEEISDLALEGTSRTPEDESNEDLDAVPLLVFLPQ